MDDAKPKPRMPVGNLDVQALNFQNQLGQQFIFFAKQSVQPTLSIHVKVFCDHIWISSNEMKPLKMNPSNIYSSTHKTTSTPTHFLSGSTNGQVLNILRQLLTVGVFWWSPKRLHGWRMGWSRLREEESWHSWRGAWGKTVALPVIFGSTLQLCVRSSSRVSDRSSDPAIGWAIARAVQRASERESDTSHERPNELTSRRAIERSIEI